MILLTANFSNINYPVSIGSGLISNIGLLFHEIYGWDDFVIVADKKVFSLYGKIFLSAFLPNQTVRTIVLPPGEKNKNLITVHHLYRKLLRLGTNRRSVIIALGGGVTGDIAGFAAATYMRGIRYIQIPTTLLAMVDSSVGGKTGVDIPEGKNIVGCFSTPEAVYIDTLFLRTLPEREMMAGFAEVIKYGIAMDFEFFRWVKQNAQALLTGSDPGLTEQAIARCCQLKNAIVAEDPYDWDRRKILNFGHTFGHALETLGGYSVLRHGEAVMIGMRMALQLSENTGLINISEAEPIRFFLDSFIQIIVRRPVIKKFIKNININRMIRYMHNDKKKERPSIQLVLLQNPGQAVLTDSCTIPQIRKAAFDTIHFINTEGRR